MDKIKIYEPFLRLIRKHESKGAVRLQGVADEYDVVWGGIRDADRPQNKVGKYLTQMTVQEVLDWQDSIDPYYQSEASGAYQIMEDTLREIRVGRHVLFDKSAQDLMTLDLLERRGLNQWKDRQITDEGFGDNIAKEWASFPVMLGPGKGQSYYAGDGLNKASCSPEEVIDVLTEVRLRLEHDIVVVEDNAEVIETLERIESKLDRLMSIFVWDGRN